MNFGSDDDEDQESEQDEIVNTKKSPKISPKKDKDEPQDKLHALQKQDTIQHAMEDTPQKEIYVNNMEEKSPLIVPKKDDNLSENPSEVEIAQPIQKA